ncbi:MAG: hypothetical protein M3460_26065 [Actinomycetota bacterium]|nr:hypothetical protein [Actinomycetota bacterium]
MTAAKIIRRDSRRHAVPVPARLRPPQRHRARPSLVWPPSPTFSIGNRELNTTQHRSAITQAHYHTDAREFLQRRRAAGDTETGSIRALQRCLSDTVYTERYSPTPTKLHPPQLDRGARGRTLQRPGHGCDAVGVVNRLRVASVVTDYSSCAGILARVVLGSL